MADPIEELLKQIQQGETARSSSAANSVPSGSSPDLSSLTDPSKPKPIDHLLAEIEDKPAVKPVPISEEPLKSGHNAPFEVVKPARSPHPQSVDALLSQLDGMVKNSPPSQPPTFPIAPPKSQSVPSKLNPPKQEPQPLAKPVLPPSPQIKNPQIEKQKRRQAIERQAQEWLKNLDPHGGEAHFFEKLAEKYPSRLEAAIDFLGLEQK